MLLLLWLVQAKKTILSCTKAGFCTTICSGAQFLNLKIDLEPDPLGVGGIFLYGRIRNETAVRQGVNGFCSIPVFHGEKNDLKFWGHRAQKLRLRLRLRLELERRKAQWF